MVQGLAQRIVAGDVPVHLLGASLLELDLPALAAGCAMPGEFEERLRSLLVEIAESPKKIILFIDELHNLVPSAANAVSGVRAGASSLMARAAISVRGVCAVSRVYFVKDLNFFCNQSNGRVLTLNSRQRL